MGQLWAKIRRVWATVGIAATIVFFGWMLIAFRASPEARKAVQPDEQVDITRGEGWWRFQPAGTRRSVGLLFFPGGLVEPAAYAPLARKVAEAGYTALIIELPRRGAFGGADGPEVLERARTAARQNAVDRWVVAGHSRGGAVAARLVFSNPAGVAGLVLIGTSHPRDFSLASSPVPVTQVYGTRDTVADVEKLEAARPNLPASTRRVRIDGGNHSQFGSYGFQPGDWPAAISRETQQRLTLGALLEALGSIESSKR